MNSIGWAVEQLREGRKVRRAGWNGKGMWLCMMPSVEIPEGLVNGRTRQHLPQGVDLRCGAYVVMWTADGTWQPGWLCSQADLLATDWELVS